MKLIDERGKFLGIINPIDLLVILLIVLVGGGILYRTQFSGAEVKPKTITAVFRVSALHPNDADDIKAGDRLVASGAVTGAEIIDVKIVPASTRNPNEDGIMVRGEDPLLKDAFVTARDSKVVGPAEIIFGGQELKIGKEFFLKTQKYEFRSIPQEIAIGE
ncbi:MAG: DUF4330 domain-containing protein [Clostridia bacterium]|nr:DUF4330 domain-containing protein [Clostridia bacterium]